MVERGEVEPHLSLGRSNPVLATCQIRSPNQALRTLSLDSRLLLIVLMESDIEMHSPAHLQKG